MHLDVNAYVVRISNAPPAELTVITYEIAVLHLENAAACLKKAGANADQECQRSVAAARKCLAELMGALDMSAPESRDNASALLELYIYSDRLLARALFERSAEKCAGLINEILGIMSKLLDAWRQAAHSRAGDTPCPESRIFLGLTYRDGRLTEYLDETAARGYEA